MKRFKYVCAVLFIFFSSFTRAVLAADPVHTVMDIADVRQNLRRMGVPFEERPLLSEYGGFQPSIHVTFPGAETAAFVLAVPLPDSRFAAGGADNRFAVETALALLRLATENKIARQYSLRIAFLGSEYARLPDDVQKNTHSGLRDLLNTVEEPLQTLILYMDDTVLPEKTALLTTERQIGWILLIRYARWRGFLSKITFRSASATAKTRFYIWRNRKIWEN